MKFYVAVTDDSWFRRLRDSDPAPDEVNFWTPGLQPVSHPVGTPWLFKLHAPNNFIVGGGYFTHYSIMPLNIAWEAFEHKNGVTSISDLQRAIAQYRRTPTTLTAAIGCVVLSDPFFWQREQWIPIPSDWAPNIVRGKYYSTEAEPGSTLWLSVRERLPKAALTFNELPVMQPDGRPRLIIPRLGQGGFRLVVTDAYARRCAVTGEKTLPALEAAHIKPFSEVKRHDVRNGLLLRADIHRLYDSGYVTVTPELKFLVSKQVHAEFSNGREYYSLSGRLIALPSSEADRPDPQYLEYHANNVYKR